MKKITASALLFFLFFLLQAQDNKRTNIWYFGYGAGLDFNVTPPKPLTDGQIQTREGCATICDTNGDLVLYTDGINIWNKNHQIIAGATDLGGDPSSTQSGIIAPQPGNPNIYYVFSVDNLFEPGGLQYAVVDISLNAGAGGLISKNNRLLNIATEKLTIIPHCNETDLWILTHEANNNHYVAWLLTATGLSSDPVVSSVGSVINAVNSMGPGYLKASPSGEKVATAIFGLHTIEIFDFDRESGRLSNPVAIQNDDRLFHVYGLEFSPNGRFLYVSNTAFTRPFLFQLDLSLGTPGAIWDSRVILGDGTDGDWGALQLGPDGVIYLTKEEHGYLSVIRRPNEPGLACDFGLDAIYLNGKLGGLGFPNLIPAFFQEETSLEILSEPNCDGSVYLTMLTNARGERLEFDWYLNGNILNFTNKESILVKEPGVYEVRLAVFKKCIAEPDRFTQTLELSLPEPIEFETLETTPGECSEPTGTITAVAVGGAGPILYSINGDEFSLNNTFTNLVGGTYMLTVRDQNNCRLSTNVFLPSTAVPVIETLESFPSNCNDRGGSIRIQASGGTVPLLYSLNGTDYFEPPVFSDLSSGSYRVFVKDANGCMASGEVSLASSDGPEFADISLGPASGSASDGEIRILVVGGNDGLTFSLNGQSTPDKGVFTGLPSGEYEVVATDTSGCSSDTILILPNLGYEVFLPNVFSPNGDGINDLFQPRTSSNADILVRSLKIFDRWGTLVFSASDLPVESNAGWWNGRFRGAPAPEGVYTFFMILEGEVRESRLISGDVLLLR